MPVVSRAFKNDLIDKTNQREEDWASLSEDKKFFYSRGAKSKIKSALGLDLEGAAPGKDKNGNLVLFELGEKGEVLDPLANGRVDSSEFLRKMFEGKIYAVPAGQDKPVQLQFAIRKNRFNNKLSGEVAFSKPIDESMAPMPERPNLWARIRHFFGGAKKEFAEYNKALKVHQALTGENLKKKRDDAFLQREKDDLAKREREAEQAKTQAQKGSRLQNLSRGAKDYVSKQDEYLRELMNVFGAQPVKNDKYIGDRYTKDQFNMLKPYDLDALGTKENPISGKEFAGLAVLGALTAESAGEIRRFPTETELTRDEHTAAMNTFFTSDLFVFEGEPRPNAGDYFEKATAPGRNAAAAALEAYRNGDKAPLGELIGRGLHFSGEYMDREELTMNSAIVVNGVTAEVLNLLERDKDLMEAAKSAGMTQKDLDLARADRKLLEVCRTNEWAKDRLEAAEKGDITLSEEEKKTCIDARVTYETLRQTIHIQHQKNLEKPGMDAEDKRYDAVLTPLNQQKMLIQAEKNKKDLTEEERLDIGARSQAIEDRVSAENFIHTFKSKTISGSPDLYGKIGRAETEGKTAEGLNRLIEKALPGWAALEKLSIAELNKALIPTALFHQDSPYMKPTRAEVPGPERQAEQLAEQQVGQKARPSKSQQKLV